MRELRSALSEMRLNDLAVGSDGRNRTILSAFRSRTGRCQPSNTKYIFGPSVWLRGLIKPPEGWGIAYIDWCQQEFGIAAMLSGDEAMQAAYRSGRSLSRVRQAGGRRCRPTPPSRSHGADARAIQAVRSGAWPMAWKPKAWRSASASPRSSPAICCAPIVKPIASSGPGPMRWSTAPCWGSRCGPRSAGRSGLAAIRTRARCGTFRCQANGAEMLRLAACFATEQGIEVCALIHDAVLIAAPLDRLDHDIERMQAAMAKASRIVLDGFELRTDVNVIRYPDRYQDPRGDVMWERVMELVAQA